MDTRDTSDAVAGLPEKQRLVAGRIEEFPPGSHPIVELGGREIGIYNVDGTLYAVQNLCPHALAPICHAEVTGTWLPSEVGEYRWGLDGRVIRCVAHGWEYDIATGDPVCGIDRRRLKTFPVAVEDGEVIVTMRPRRPRA
jgi:nitrite reductase (NADH) small subunit